MRLEGTVLVMTAPDGTSAMTTAQPDAGMIAAFMDAVFGYCEGFVPVRALAEKGGPGRPPHTPFIAADSELAAKTAVQAAFAADAGLALYVVPGTVAQPGEARAEDVQQTQVVLVDLDHGDVAAKRHHLLKHLGEPSLEVASGGVTPEGQAKLHLYWRLTEPAEGDDIACLCRLRHIIAVKAGGDSSFRSPHQPIRVAGSVYRKNGTARLVRIIAQRSRDYDLGDFAEAVMAMPPLESMVASGSDLDFNDAGSGTGAIADVFVQRVREGGADGITRFDAISKVIGYWIRRARDGHVTPAGAWDEIVAYNEARVDPPWPLDRLQTEAERLWKRDRENNGAIEAACGDDGGNGVVLPVGFTEDALALEFTRSHGDDWRYVAGWGQWLVWCGTHWQKETTLRAYDLARLVCRDAARRCNNRKVSTKLSTAATVSAVERLARADRRHAATTEEWDRDLWALNTPGGVVDLRNGTSRPHDRADRITKITTAAPSGDCPAWRAFLATVTGGDAELQAYLARMAGYALTGVTSEHALFFLYGTGANGKSVFVNTFAGILGDYAANAPMDSFMVTQGERHPTDMAGLRGAARLVTSIETEQGRRWAESKLKALTGGDKIAARFMRQDFFEFVPQFKLVVAGNHKPAIRNVDIAMRRRLHMVPFTFTIPDDRRDKALPQKLLFERDGILAWALQGCLEWQRIGLTPPASVVAATEEYFEAEDALGRWLDECCLLGPNLTETTANLFAAWKAWADAAGEFPGSQKRFADLLVTRGFAKWRDTTGNRRGFRGLTLRGATWRPYAMESP
jgi:P4 family phage/plasmid primase-like protien